MQGIYKIINKVNGKYYVGSSQGVKRRYREHRNGLQAGCGSIVLQRAWNKYGEENFVFEFVEEILGDKKAYLVREQIYLDEGFSKGVIYNIARRASGGPIRHTEEAIAKIREAHAKPYPTFVNIVTGEVIPAGVDLYKMCQECNLVYANMNNLRRGTTRHTMTGWMVEGMNRDVIGAGRGKPYPAFYNVKTGQFISAGCNLGKMCREQGLSCGVMEELRRGVRRQSLDGWCFASEREKAKKFGNNQRYGNNAKPYPAFFNDKIGKFIPAGINLAELCRKQGLSYGIMYWLKANYTRISGDGWRLATLSEIREKLNA